MKKKILTILALGIILSSCSRVKDDFNNLIRLGRIKAGKEIEDRTIEDADDNYLDDNDDDNNLEKDNENHKIEVKEKKKSTSKEEKSALFAGLQGKIIYDCIANSGERLYFREDGNFDGITLYGDGMNMSYSLFKGQFSNPKKIDDNTYTVRLTKFTYQTPKSGSFIDGKATIRYTDSINFDPSQLGEEFTIHLPSSNIGDLENRGYTVDLYYKEDYPGGKAGAYMISKENLKQYPDLKNLIFMKELPETTSDPVNENDSNVFELKSQAGSKQETKAGQIDKPKKTQGINTRQNEFFSHADQIDLSEMILSNYEEEKKQAIGQVNDLEGGLKFLNTGSNVLYNIGQSQDFKDMFENKTLSDLDLESTDKQPIIKVLGNIRDKKEIKPRYETDNKVTTYTLLAAKRTGEKILISLDFCGDIDTATFIQEDGSELVKTWAVPMGVYKKKDKDLGEITVYKFAAGEGTQQAAYELYGETYGF